jgi:hypothetical protein
MSVKILLIFSAVFIGFLSWQCGHDLAMWRASQHRAYMAEQERIEKEAAFIAEFEGLRIYAMPDGVLVEEN